MKTNRKMSEQDGAAGASSLRAFTLIELLVVISIIGILASLIVGISGAANTTKRISAVQGKLSELEVAIENYKASIGSYPPDARFSMNPASSAINTVTNQLFYELTGTVFQQDRSYLSNQGGDPLNRQACRSIFGVDGFQNVARNSTQSDSFLELGASDFAAISARPAVNLLIAPARWPNTPIPGVDSRGRELENYRPIKSDDPALRTLNPWQYRASGRDRFNLQSFDLWADVPIGGKIYRISNWTTDHKVISRAD